jgi:hypothetical protein
MARQTFASGAMKWHLKLSSFSGKLTWKRDEVKMEENLEMSASPSEENLIKLKPEFK